jgi:hypothetical protein
MCASLSVKIYTGLKRKNVYFKHYQASDYLILIANQ